jgi:hypothetical protein
MKIMLILAVGLSALVTGATAAPQHQLTGPGFKQVAYFTQDLTLEGLQSTALKVAPLTSSVAGFGLSQLAVTFPGGTLGAMKTILLPQPVNQGTALTKALTDIPENFLLFKPTLNAWLVTKQISTAILDYSQEILVSVPVTAESPTGTVRKVLAFNARLDADGRATYGAPKLIDPNPTMLEVTYTPLKTIVGLPAGWGYPDAGTLKWRLLNKDFSPITGFSSMNLGGVYDEASSYNPTDPDAMVRCLMESTTAGCTPAVDVKTLMGQVGASQALVGYIRSVEPLYSPSSNGTMTSSLAISVLARTWDCMTYENSGVFGMTLELKADQYLATNLSGNINFRLVRRIQAQAVSPTESYGVSMPMPASSGDPSSLILSPIPGVPAWPQSDSAKMAMVTEVAPMELLGFCRMLPSGVFTASDPATVDINGEPWEKGQDAEDAGFGPGADGGYGGGDDGDGDSDGW